MKWPFLAKSRAYYLNLARRADRRERFLQVVEPHAWLPPLMQRIEAVDGQSLAIPALPSRLIAGQARLLAEVAESDSSQLLGKDRRHMARSWISKPTRGAGPF